MGIFDWLGDRGRDIADVSPGAWTALAAWLAVVVAIAASLYVHRQVEQAKQQSAALTQPNVAMFMEPSAQDWHLVELVVKNFGRKPAFGIRFDFRTVGQYETAYQDSYVNIVPLNLPAEIPFLAPSQEWRIVWDTALDRRQLGERIESRFDGAVTYYDKPSAPGGPAKGKRQQYRTSARSAHRAATICPPHRPAVSRCCRAKAGNLHTIPEALALRSSPLVGQDLSLKRHRDVVTRGADRCFSTVMPSRRILHQVHYATREAREESSARRSIV